MDLRMKPIYEHPNILLHVRNFVKLMNIGPTMLEIL